MSAERPVTDGASSAKGLGGRRLSGGLAFAPQLLPRFRLEAARSRFLGAGSPGIFGGDKPLKMERFESRASRSAR
jgi:hypothetical protein